MKSRLYVPLQEVHPILIEIINRIKKIKKGSNSPFVLPISIKRKLSHHKQDTLVHPGWHRRRVPEH